MGRVKKPGSGRRSPSSIDSIDGPHVLAFSDRALVLGPSEDVAAEVESGERSERRCLAWLGCCSFSPTSLTLISPPLKSSSGSCFSNAARPRETVLHHSRPELEDIRVRPRDPLHHPG